MKRRTKLTFGLIGNIILVIFGAGIILTENVSGFDWFLPGIMLTIGLIGTISIVKDLFSSSAS
ncbi:hypothetical protein [Salsuginibacillus kocurii]|uniref:hypothetical protein n=1 Tax=Salsuginibacillus kocurii TaxID=427078 RepID=UPI000366AAAD|nr:hypothetical protein [Salsuginibacillus kocurii]